MNTTKSEAYEPDHTEDGVDHWYAERHTVVADTTGRQVGWFMLLDGDVIEPESARALADALHAAADAVELR